MSKKRTGTLIGAIRLVGEVDSIGVPVFAARSANALCVPEMDDDFRIAKFLDFYNEHGYSLEHFNISPASNSVFRIGDATPIPFWIDGHRHLINGTADEQELLVRFGPTFAKNLVLRDLNRLLGDARHGRVRLRRQKWEADDMALRFDDILAQPPVRSRYWISRFRSTVARAREIAPPPHVIDRDLNRAGRKWLTRFATKSDLNMIRSILGDPKDGVFSESEIDSILFAYFAHKIVAGASEDVAPEALKGWFVEKFPEGLYSTYVRRGFPSAPFKYRTTDDFQYILRQELYRLIRLGHYRHAALSTKLYFGSENPPTWIDGVVDVQLHDEAGKLRSLIARGEEILLNRNSDQSWAKCASAILSQFEKVSYLDSILHGNWERRDELAQRKFKISPDYLNFVRNHLRSS